MIIKSNKKLKHFWVIWGIIILSVFFYFVVDITRAEVDETIDDLSKKINETKARLEELQKQSAVYQKNIRVKQEEAMSLKNQLDILANKIAKTKLDIEATQEEVKKTKLEIQQTQISIINTENVIDKKKEELGEIMRQIDRKSQSDLLEIFVLNNSISDFLTYIENTKNLTASLNSSLGQVKKLKSQLIDKQTQLESKEDKLKRLLDELELAKIEYEGQEKYKKNLLADTKESEEKFINLYWQVKREQEIVNNEIFLMEKSMRAKLAELEKRKTILTDSTLIWPVQSRKITTTFYDPLYPFRHLFEHAAIDIATPQGTAIKSAADGYVLIAKDAGMGYSYISIMHANGLSTVYGHVSKIYVQPEEYVTKGEVIGLTGGMPGTPGAGRLTTGPHLHFEVRLNGIPVDPMNYLP